ncbi:hypothetical protein [Pseudovibrio brasiliensis]|uniref:Nucleotidyl transferase AbiEii toxin, Type IV TA system n=1 Tax=Pseudovibrio brasiliensis TaxID=1898042 RepID=A0ABX8AVF8_9HYPH|nr:hypothetical protein [Pseudovibrio brasiliensis]QUS59039.1 hypothetical protein KGB56_25835 [Pseudovibrio brasiliensis]
MVTVSEQLMRMLEMVAEALGKDLRQRLVFVGGCTTALFITDKVTLEDVRATDDVDLIIDLAGYASWADMQNTLRERGFTETPEDDVICRMRLGELKVDFMPDDEAILGFSNRWYPKGIETALDHKLTEELTIKKLAPELFVATKLEAYLGRGNNDLFFSRDMEDILLIVDGREELFEELQGSEADIRDYVAEQFRALLKHRDFSEFVEGNIRGPEGRADMVLDRFEKISQGGGGN